MIRSPLRTYQIACVLFLLSCCLTGCSPTLETRYADPRGASINGLSVFVDMVRQTGTKVELWPGVSSQMEYRYGTIIVFVSSYDAATPELTKNLQTIIRHGLVNQVLFVVRDSNLAIDFWRQIADNTKENPERKAAIERMHSYATESLERSSRFEFDESRGIWYGLKKVDRTPTETVRTVEIKTNEAPTTVSARWQLNRRLVPPEPANILWHSGDDPLLIRQKIGDVNVMVLASATPVLNGGLIDPGNRELAIELIKWFPTDESIAVALSSRWIPESEEESPGLLRFMKVHPIGWVFGQGIFAILLFCWWKFPIFGRPRSSLNLETVRFGRHVEAFGMLLRRSGDKEFAWNRIRAWYGKENK